jgi:hypothetical protein
MLSQQEVREMQALVTRVQQGSGSRADWSTLAALTLIWQGDATTTAIAAEGFDAFVDRCRPVYHGHAFQFEDYRRMYDRICAAAARARRDLVH